jgi:hypothetical protein
VKLAVEGCSGGAGADVANMSLLMDRCVCDIVVQGTDRCI